MKQPSRKIPYESIEKQITQALRVILYDPLLQVLKEGAPAVARRSILNADEGVLGPALRAGTIQLTDGVFSGAFNSAISGQLRRMGAKWDRRANVFRLPVGQVPNWVLSAATVFKAKARDIHEALGRRLDTIEANLQKSLDAYPVNPADMVNGVNEGFKHVAKELEIMPVLGPEARKKLEEAYQANLRPLIKEMTEEQIHGIRDDVEKNALTGYRFTALMDDIQHRYSVGRTRATLIARTETSTFMSKFRATRYGEAGITRYRWTTAHDERVRPWHKHLDGMIREYANPPVIDERTGSTGNPGEFPNCFPYDSRVDFACGIKKAFRHRFNGKLTSIILESKKTIRATPNHPVLTLCGWKPIGLLNNSDYVLDISKELRFPTKSDVKKSVPMIGKIFEALRESYPSLFFPGERKQFHGDGSDCDVNVVNATRGLINSGKIKTEKPLQKDIFSPSPLLTTTQRELLSNLSPLILSDQFHTHMGGRSQGTSFLKRKPGHTKSIRLRPISDRYTIFNKPSTDNYAADSSSKRDRKLALTTHVSINERLWVKLKSILVENAPPSCFGRFIRVHHVFESPFRGDVFNLETVGGYYTTDGVVVSNCRCIDLPILRRV